MLRCFHKTNYNSQIIGYYRKILPELSELSKKYGYCYDKLAANVQTNIVDRIEYGKTESPIFHGFYCPSPIYDLIYSGVKRGMIYQRLTPKSKPNYRYLWSGSRLIQTELLDEVPCNIFDIYEDNQAISIYYSNVIKECSSLSQSRYGNTGRITLFRLWNCIGNGKFEDITSLHEERFIYGNDGLLSYADVYEISDEKENLMFSHLPAVTSHDRYYFQHDADGYLTSYQLCVYDLSEIPSKLSDPIIITEKRKI